MNEIWPCITAFIVTIVAILALFYMGKNANSSDNLTKKDWKLFYKYFCESTKTSEKLFVVFAYSALVLKTSYFGAAAAVSIAGLTGAAAVCGQSPWPYIKEVLLWFSNNLASESPDSTTTSQ